MARKKSDIEKAAAAGAAAAMAAQSGDHVLDLDDDDEDESEAKEVFRALRELGATDDEITWQVQKTSGPPNERGFIERLPTSQLDIQFFRDKYGPGMYRVMGYRRNSYVKGGQLTVTISDVGYKSPLNTAPAAAPKETLTEIMAVLDKRSEARAAEWKSWAQVLAPLLAPAVVAWLKPRENQVTELVSGLAALKGLTPDPPKPEGLESQLDKILGVMDKLKEAQGAQSSTGATWVDIVRDGIQGAKPLLEGLAGRLVNPGAAPGMMPALPPPSLITAPAPFGPTSSLTPSPPAPGSAAPPSTDPTSQGNGKPVAAISLLPWLRQNLEALIYQAGRNKDPGLYASVMLDNIPPGIDPALLKSFIERLDWWAQLQQFAPGVSPYPAWFEEFREAVLEILNTPPEEPEVPSAGPAQPAGNSDEPTPDAFT